MIRELIVTVDDEARRLAYAVVEGARPPLDHHHASFEVRPEGDEKGRLIWTTEVLPHASAAEIRIRVERGAWEMKQAIEANTRLSRRIRRPGDDPGPSPSAFAGKTLVSERMFGN